MKLPYDSEKFQNREEIKAVHALVKALKKRGVITQTQIDAERN